MKRVILFFSLVISIFYKAQNYYLFIGTFTKTDSKGIYVYNFDSKTGKLTWLANTDKVINPSFLTITPDAKFIYACTESRTDTGGSVSAFSFDKKTNVINFINKQASCGANPVYIKLHKNNKWLVNANYTGSNISVFKINDDGSIKAASQKIKLEGNSIDKERQEKAHPHSVNFSNDYKYLIVPDLGSDKIMSYEFDEKNEQPLKASKKEFASTVPASGPRHFAFHPNGKFAYCIEELSGTIQAFGFKEGKLDSLQFISTHVSETAAPYSSADIHISPDGKFLYAANRGKENNIAIFSIDKNGKLKIEGYQSTLGETPRNFMIDPTGNFLLVANQTSGNIVVFSRNIKTGLLTDTGEQIKIPLPSCLQMVESK